LLDIPFSEDFHNALADASYTAEVFKKIYSKNIKPKIRTLYKNKKDNKQDKRKQTIDYDSLINQFEKMFNREITEEEKSMIKLAYIMGNTNQFQK